MPFIIILQNQSIFTPTFVVGASPSCDETVAEVEDQFVRHVMRSADWLDVISEVERRTEEYKCHIIVRRDVIVVLVHFDFTDGANLCVISRSR